MAGGREYSGHQQKIIRRHYETLDTRSLNRLQEVVSELALTEDQPKRTRLWKSAETALKNLQKQDEQARLVLEQRDVQGLAKLVERLSR